MEAFESFEHAGYTCELHYDDDPISPADWDTLGTLYAFSNAYVGMEQAPSMASEALDRGGVALLIRYLSFCGITAVPFDIYEHGGTTIREASETDDNCYGYISADSASIEMTGCPPELVEEGLRGELREWASYFEGAVVGYVVKSPDGDTLESCWGFYPDDEGDGLNYVRGEAREQAEWLAKQDAEAPRYMAL